MISHTTADFRLCYQTLPIHLRLLARKQYRLWKSNLFHPSLQFKKVGPKLWSCRLMVPVELLPHPLLTAISGSGLDRMTTISA